MMRKIALFCVVALMSSMAFATIFGSIQGIIHDPQHRPVAGAQIVVKSATSDFSKSMQTNQDGGFLLTALPLGDYVVTVNQQGFAILQQSITVASESSS